MITNSLATYGNSIKASNNYNTQTSITERLRRIYMDLMGRMTRSPAQSLAKKNAANHHHQTKIRPRIRTNQEWIWKNHIQMQIQL